MVERCRDCGETLPGPMAMRVHDATDCVYNFRARIAKLEAVVAAQLYVIQVATDLRGWETTAPPSLVAEFDAAKAELEREQGGEA